MLTTDPDDPRIAVLEARNVQLEDMLADSEARRRDADAFVEFFDCQGPILERLLDDFVGLALARRDPALLEKARVKVNRAIEWLYDERSQSAAEPVGRDEHRKALNPVRTGDCDQASARCERGRRS